MPRSSKQPHPKGSTLTGVCDLDHHRGIGVIAHTGAAQVLAIVVREVNGAALDLQRGVGEGRQEGVVWAAQPAVGQWCTGGGHLSGAPAAGHAACQTLGRPCAASTRRHRPGPWRMHPLHRCKNLNSGGKAAKPGPPATHLIAAAAAATIAREGVGQRRHMGAPIAGEAGGVEVAIAWWRGAHIRGRKGWVAL